MFISWQSVLFVEETGVSRENHRPVASYWQTLSHNIVHIALREIRIELSVVIGNDCIGSCKSNYHTITATTPPTRGYIYFLLGYFKYINMIFFFKYYTVFWSVQLVILFKQEFVICFFFVLYFFVFFTFAISKWCVHLYTYTYKSVLKSSFQEKKLTLVEPHTLWGQLGMRNDSNTDVFVLARKCTCL